MLINASQAEEVRVAIVNGSVLDNLDIEILGKEQQKANVYKGKITRIEPSLEAVFVDYGGERHGFLPFREISKIYHRVQGGESAAEDEETPGGEEGNAGSEKTRFRRPSLRDRFYEGQELVVQVEKEARGNKGAALTTFISLAGCYLVLMPLNPTAGGISRRIDSEDRAELREVLQNINIPVGMGVIVRTAGVGRDDKDLQWDLDFLLQQWRAIEKASLERGAPFLIYQESNVVVRAIRDHLRPEINEILVDSPRVHEDVLTYVRMMRPDYINRVKLYNDSIPLFSRFQIESQIENAMQREVRLPSGGSIVIDHTEALISIDINSAKATKGGDIEETALQTNLEAAEAIARQLRLRDIGGLIVIDFIDMGSTRNQRAVEQKLKEAMEVDRARVQIGKISSRFGLLEMSRQRLRPPLASARDIVCPRCLGRGSIRGVEVLAINVIRLIEEEAIKDGTAQVIIEVPTEVATYLINEKRQAVLEIERKHHIRVLLVPSQHLETPNFVITRSKKDEITTNTEVASYTLASKPEAPKNAYNQPASAVRQQAAPAVSNMNPSMAPQRKGIIKRLLSLLATEEPKTNEPRSARSHGAAHTPSPRPYGNNNRSRNNNNRQRNRPRTPNSSTNNRQTNGNTTPHSHSTHQPRERVEENREEREIKHAPAHTPREDIVIAEAPIVHETSTIQVEVLPNSAGSEAPATDENGSTSNNQRRRKQNRRRNHYRKGQGHKARNEEATPTETKVGD